MKKTIFLFILFLTLGISNSWSAISLIADTCAGGTTGAINTTGASLIVVSVAHTTTVPTPTDSMNNTWTALNLYSINNPANDMFYVSNPTTSATHTFTGSLGICVLAFSGTLVTSSPLDAQNGSTAAGTTLSTGSVTPNFNNEVLVTGVGINFDSTVSIDSGFTVPSNGYIDFSSGLYYGMAMAYLVETTAAAKNPTWTRSVGDPWAGGIATFEAAPSPGSRLGKGTWGKAKFGF